MQPPTHAYEPTNEVDLQSISIGEGAKQVMLSIWDMAGEPAFAAHHQPYYCDGSIYCLCVPALDVAELEKGYFKYVGRWLEALQMGASTAVVLPVLTKCDLLPAVGQFKDTSAQALSNQAHAQVAWLTEKLEAHQAKQPAGIELLKIQMDVMCTSSVTEGGPSLEAVRAKWEGICMSEPPLLPTCGMGLNRTMVLTTVFLRAIRDGRDPIDSARASDLGYIPSTMSTELKPIRYYIELEDLKTIFADEFAPALKLTMPSDPGTTLMDALKLLTNQGEMCFSASGLVYLQPDYISRMVQPLCNPRMGNRLWCAREFSTQDALRLMATGESVPEHERNLVTVAAEALAKTGELREELLAMLWEATSLRRDDFAAMLVVLAARGVLLLAEDTKFGRRWMLPMRAPETCPGAVREMWTAALSQVEFGGLELLNVAIALGPLIPPGVFERFAATCYGLGTVRRMWRQGAFVEVDPNGKLGGATSYLLFELRKKSQRVVAVEGDPPVVGYELVIEALGNKSKRAHVFAGLVQVLALMRTSMGDVPTLASHGQSVFICPCCLKGKAAEPSSWPIADVAARKLTCDKCSESISLNNAPQMPPLNQRGALGLTLALHPDPLRPEAKFVAEKLRFGRPLQCVLPMYALLGLAETEEVERLKSSGESAIVDELNAYASSIIADEGGSEALPRDDNGWADVDWLQYLTASAQTPAAEDDAAKALADKLARLQKQASDAGLDKGRADSSLDYWVKRPVCVSAGLQRGHLLALRLYSAGVFRRFNTPLSDGCIRSRRHPYPTACILLNEAIGRLRNAQIEQRRAAVAKAARLAEEARKAKEDEDEDVVEKAVAAAKEAAATNESLKVSTFYRGACSINPIEFKQRGGTEVGFLSMSKSRTVAQVQAFHCLAAANKLDEAATAAQDLQEEEPVVDEEEEEEIVYLPLVSVQRLKKAANPNPHPDPHPDPHPNPHPDPHPNPHRNPHRNPGESA